MSKNYADLRGLLQIMLASRAGDLREQSLIRQGKGWFHISGMGHEMLAILARELRPEDFCFPYYRDRALMLARGMTTYEMALAFFAKKVSSSGGRQMPQHYSNRRLNIWSMPSAVAANLLPACGAAWGLQLDRVPGLVLASCGDAATRQGEFFEAVNFAREKKLPVLFLVEDNGLGISSITEKTNPLALGIFDRQEWTEVDGCNPLNLQEAGSRAIARIRAGQGPAFLWIKTERISSHSSADDQRKYRDPKEIDIVLKRDPILLLKNRLLAEGALTEQEFSTWKQTIDASVREDYQRAEREADPQAEDLLDEIYGPVQSIPSLELDLGEKTRMVDAINGVFHAALASSRKFVFFGQDIEDPKGGVFSLTKGLTNRHPGHVFNSPLAESTIVGVAVGLASYGKMPVFEIQFIDFIPPGWNQLVTNLANLRWRTMGEWKCPCVIYAPYGAYLPGGGLMHSQTNESAIAHYPGLKVVVPSTPEDAAGLLWSALHGQDPVVFLIPKHLLWHEVPLKEKPYAIPLGKARVIQTGKDITLVTWGNCREVVQDSLAKIDADVSVELIDLRTIVPLDLATVAESVRKTGRLLVVQEDSENCSVGQSLITRLCGDEAVWQSFVARPILISKPNVNIGFNPVYEYAAIPDSARILSAIRDLMSPRESPLVSRLQAGWNQVLANIPRLQGTASAARQEEAAAVVRPSIPAITALFSEAPAQITELRHLVVPQLGEGITQARLINIFRQAGETVAGDDSVCEVETDKALFPVEAPFPGTIKEWLVQVEQTVEVGQPLAILEVVCEDGARTAEPARAEPERRPSTVPTEGGLAPHIVSQMRNVVSTHMTMIAGWENIRKVRAQAKARLGREAPTPTTMLAWAIVRAMTRHPIFCCTINLQDTLTPQAEFDFGVAVSLQNDALETAVIPKAARHSWTEFNQIYNQAVATVRSGKSVSKARTPLILTSMGGFNVRFALPVVVPPAIATLFVGEAYWDVGVEQGQRREIVNLCLSFDHRWINGVAGAAFLNDVIKEMETLRLP